MKLLPFAMERRLRGLKFRLSRNLRDRQPAEVWSGIDTTAVTLRPFAGQFGNLQRYELMVLCAVARRIGARKLFEFGTFDGLTAWHLAANAGPGSRIWTLDLPLNHPSRYYKGHDRTVGRIHAIRVGAQFSDTPEAGRIEQLYGDSLARLLALVARRAEVPRRSIERKAGIPRARYGPRSVGGEW